MFNSISTYASSYREYELAQRSQGIEIDEVAYNVAYTLGVIDPDLGIFHEVGVRNIQTVLKFLNPDIFQETIKNDETFTPVHYINDPSMEHITLFLERNKILGEPSLDSILSLLQIHTPQ